MGKKKKIVIIFLALLLILVIWTIWGNVTVSVTRYRIVSDRLPDAFSGYKIAVVSDLHNAQFGEGNSQITELVQEEHPDVIAITGDLVDANRTDVETAITLVKKLTQIAPCYYVNGNNEADIGQQYLDLETMLVAENVVVLHNEVIRLERSGQEIQLAGLDDPAFADGDNTDEGSLLQTNLKKMNLSEDYCVLLSHRPETFKSYVAEDIDLVLSGHAHGGQFRLPFIGGIVAPNQGFFPKYDAGIYSENHTTMIVSRGIGNSIIPVRFNNRPEIVVVELNCK